MNHAALSLRKYYALLAFLFCLAVFFVHIIWFAPADTTLLTEIWKPLEVLQAETAYLYALLHGFMVLPIVALSFDRRVAFHTKWKFLLPAIIVVALPFIIWDFLFTKVGVWGFSELYTLDYRFLHLPIEEWMFFVSAPFACLFIYECLRYYFPLDTFKSFDKWITFVIISVLSVVGILYWGKLYTSVTCLATAALLLAHYLSFDNTYRTFFYKAQLVSFLPFTLVNGILTGSITKEPVVQYNPIEMLGIRIITIPIEDFVYCFMLLFSVVTIYEYLRERRTRLIK